MNLVFVDLAKNINVVVVLYNKIIVVKNTKNKIPTIKYIEFLDLNIFAIVCELVAFDTLLII